MALSDADVKKIAEEVAKELVPAVVEELRRQFPLLDMQQERVRIMSPRGIPSGPPQQPRPS